MSSGCSPRILSGRRAPWNSAGCAAILAEPAMLAKGLVRDQFEAKPLDLKPAGPGEGTPWGPARPAAIHPVFRCSLRIHHVHTTSGLIGVGDRLVVRPDPGRLRESSGAEFPQGRRAGLA